MVHITKLTNGTYNVNGRFVTRSNYVTILPELERIVFARYLKGENFKMMVETSVMPVDQPTFNEMGNIHQIGLK